MSLNSILNIASSGLSVAQTQLRVVSDNVANVNTPGYIRKIADQVSLTTQGTGSGVDVARVRLATDSFLQAAAFKAGGDAARQTVKAELYDRIQSLFGDPGSDTGFFSRIETAFASFAAVSESPTSGPYRQDSLTRTQALFNEAGRVARQIQTVRQEADSRIQSGAARINDLLGQIEGLNQDISRAIAINGDASGSQTAQAELITQLSSLIDVQVSSRNNGGVSLRSSSGVLLAGPGAAIVSYRGAGVVSAESTFADIVVTEPSGLQKSLTADLKSGEIKGLLELRDVEAPAASVRLAELTTRIADELNRAHNANSSVPAPTSLSGRNVGQSLVSAIAGFSGNTTIALVDPVSGAVQSQVDIQFSGGTITVNGTATTPAGFLATLNAELGGAATASFDQGRLSLNSNTSAGIAIADDATNPSNKAGRGFSHYFGLNDLVTSDRTTLYDIGLTSSSPHGFTPGETVTLRVSDGEGGRLRDVSIAVPAGAGTVGELLAAFNNPISGVGRYGSFGLDPTTGSVTFNGNGSPALQVSAFDDRTTQVPSGVSVTDLLGIGAGVRASRADAFSIRSDIQLNPSRLALAKLNLDAGAGQPALSAGDGRGGQALSDASTRQTNFGSGGGSAGGVQTVSRYAAELSGDIGSRAETAQRRADVAQAISVEATTRRSNKEGVNLDEELVAMTTFQQSFNASARLIQSVRDMYDILLGIV